MGDKLNSSSRLTVFAISAVLLAIVMSACGGSSSAITTQPAATSTTSSASGGTPSSITTSASTPAAPVGTVTVAPSPTETPAAAATSSGSGSTSNSRGTPTAGSSQAYLDDRSTAEELIRSYYNAINSQEYARAYSYWESGVSASQLPPFDQFRQGYETTLFVDVSFGAIGDGVAAGNIYYAVPVELLSKTGDKGVLTYVGCYTLHLGQPANYAVPPVPSMAIQSADIKQVAGSANPKDLLASACSGQPGNNVGTGTTATAVPNDISADVYLDNRSDGPAVVRSFYNAINQKEYARAYSYWESDLPASTLAPFPQFEQGYATTESVTLEIGKVTTDAGAGQRYASVPTTIVATMKDGSTQTFVGCYVTHLASPAIQTEPPFQPMSIARASVTKVDNNADTSSLMASACQP